MTPTEATGWVGALAAFVVFVRENWGVVAFLAALIALFGFRFPRSKPWIEVHGLLRSLWVGAQAVGTVGDALERIEGKMDRLLKRWDQRFGSQPDTQYPPPPSRQPSFSGFE